MSLSVVTSDHIQFCAGYIINNVPVGATVVATAARRSFRREESKYIKAPAPLLGLMNQRLGAVHNR